MVENEDSRISPRKQREALQFLLGEDARVGSGVDNSGRQTTVVTFDQTPPSDVLNSLSRFIEHTGIPSSGLFFQVAMQGEVQKPRPFLRVTPEAVTVFPGALDSAYPRQ